MIYHRFQPFLTKWNYSARQAIEDNRSTLVDGAFRSDLDYASLTGVEAVFRSFDPLPTQMVLELRWRQCESFGEVSFGDCLID